MTQSNALSWTNADSSVDATLVRAMARGDQVAFAALFDLHGGALFLKSRARNDAETAEREVFLAFLQAWRRADEYSCTRQNVASWLAAFLPTP